MVQGHHSLRHEKKARPHALTWPRRYRRGHVMLSRSCFAPELAAGRGRTARRLHAARPATACARGGWARRLIASEVLDILELILRRRALEFFRRAILARNDAERVRGQRDFLCANAQETANADYDGFDLSALVKQDVAHVAYFLIVRADNIGALELARKPLIRLLRGYEVQFSRPLGLCGRWAGRFCLCRGSVAGRTRWTGCLRKRSRRQGGAQRSRQHQFLEHLSLLSIANPQRQRVAMIGVPK